jgi:hypothetical protein
MLRKQERDLRNFQERRERLCSPPLRAMLSAFVALQRRFSSFWSKIHQIFADGVWLD